MKVKDSAYLAEKKPVFARLLEELLARYPYASVFAQDSRERSYSVNRRMTSISGGGMFAARGFLVKVFDGAHWSEHSFNEISEESLPEILEAIGRTAAMSERALPEGVAERVYAAPTSEKLTFSDSTDFEIDPEELGDEELLDRLTAIQRSGQALDPRLIDCAVRAVWHKGSSLFLGPDRDLTQNVLWMTGSVGFLASKGQDLKHHGKSVSGLGGAELLRDLGEDLRHHADVTLELLDSVPLPPGEYECVCKPEVTGMIVHEAFGHGVEMDMFVKDRAQAKRFMGQYVASPLVTMHDGAAAQLQTGTYFFDDEGTLAHDTVIIDKGVLVSGISDYQSAMTLGTEPTGNGRRESYRRKAYTRMTNTWFAGGTDTPEDMIASVKDGLLLEDPSSGMEDPKNWGIQCMVSFAREIKDGKLTGRIFSPIVLTGYVPDLLKSITMMSPAPELSGGGMCGKGYKEWVKVSDGGPWMKARIRLG